MNVLLEAMHLLRLILVVLVWCMEVLHSQFTPGETTVNGERIRDNSKLREL